MLKTSEGSIAGSHTDMPRDTSFGDRATENRQRLAAYDRLSANDSKASNEQQKTEFEQAFKLSEQQRKAQAAESRLSVAQDRLSLAERAQQNQAESAKALRDISEERQKMQVEIATNAQLLKEQHELVREKATAARINAGMEFYKGMGQLKPQSPDFPQKYSELMSKVYGNLVDSEGKIPEEIQSTSNHLLSQHNAWAAAQIKPENMGTVSTTTKDGDVTTRVTVPKTPSADATMAAKQVEELKAQHATLEATMVGNKSKFTGAPQAADVGALNAVKSKLGYDLLDPATGQVVAKPAAVAAVPVVPTSAPADPFDSPVPPATPAPVATPAIVVPAAPDGFNSAEDVRSAYRAGKLPRADAESILKDKFGHQ